MTHGLNVTALDFHTIHPLLQQQKITCRQLVEHCLTKINEGIALNAFISVFATQALHRAAVIDEKIRQACAGPLAGLVVAVKDNILVKGERTTCGSKMLSGFIAPYNATVIERLEAADAIIIGKTNMDEFGMGSSNENSYFGAVRNPFDQSHVAGGSSGGSAAAVAAGMCLAALSSDTGGSVRQPAAFCGIVGLKPTYGRVSRYGLVAYASSCDQIGIMARTVTDTATVLECIAGYDERDSTALAESVPSYSEALAAPLERLRIGLPAEYLGPGLNPEVRAGVERCVGLLEQAGTAIVRISLPHTEFAVAAYYILATAEASSNLARYDGIRYGYRTAHSAKWEEMVADSRSEGFGEEVKRRIMWGTYVLSAGYYDAYYRKAQQVRTLIKSDFSRAFEKCDCILAPTTPTTAFALGEKLADPLVMYLSDVYTVAANLAGLPALALPVGFDSRHLPIGIQLLVKPLHEQTALRVGYRLEQLLTHASITSR
ncbi:MAG: Asp-tRNA(Asn)/Glu-tRNA(Gln) amidotransferase subunit GatA [candidate division KSB1 bacterium]|nr:Asp-tRNA(Asn)/Glu-tRNA(Gln) amidotransferase subunit GatA [candidate division KSB1 bacterium]MDZ7339920.1 Asp-tRNA(Asn)/Glu-tRNA(Gln) amidotransferase subunit GatA [candidate division KSB1 bacterium]